MFRYPETLNVVCVTIVVHVTHKKTKTRLIYNDVIAIKVILFILVVLILTYFLFYLDCCTVN